MTRRSRHDRIAVVIPVHNRGDELGRALRSLRIQSDRDLQIVICDDGSTEDIAPFVDEFRSELDLRVLRIPRSGGPARPRNVAIDAIDADWISFLDSDDEWFSGKVEAIRGMIAAGADVIYHRLIVRHAIAGGTSPRDRRRSVGCPLRGPSAVVSMVRYGNPLATSGTTVRREMLLHHGKFCEDPDLQGVEDFDLWFRLAGAGARFSFIPSTLGAYWVHSGSISTRDHAAYRRHVALFGRQVRHVEERYRRLAESSSQYRLGMLADQLGLDEAREHFLRVKLLQNPLYWLRARARAASRALHAPARRS